MDTDRTQFLSKNEMDLLLAPVCHFNLFVRDALSFHYVGNVLNIPLDQSCVCRAFNFYRSMGGGANFLYGNPSFRIVWVQCDEKKLPHFELKLQTFTSRLQTVFRKKILVDHPVGFGKKFMLMGELVDTISEVLPPSFLTRLLDEQFQASVEGEGKNIIACSQGALTPSDLEVYAKETAETIRIAFA